MKTIIGVFAIVGLGMTAAGLAIAAAPVPSFDAPATVRPAAASDAAAVQPGRWVSVRRPVEVFSLSAPGFGATDQAYAGERDPSGDGRRDTLSIGSLDADGPFAAISVVRMVSADGRELGDTARRLAGGTLTDASEPSAMATKFGDMSAASLSAGQPGRKRSCIAFGRHEEAMRFAVQGLVCGAPGAVIDRRTASCLVDRLDLVSAGRDTSLRGYFAAAETRRNFCGAGDLQASRGRPAAPAATAPRQMASIR